MESALKHSFSQEETLQDMVVDGYYSDPRRSCEPGFAQPGERVEVGCEESQV